MWSDGYVYIWNNLTGQEVLLGGGQTSVDAREIYVNVIQYVIISVRSTVISVNARTS